MLDFFKRVNDAWERRIKAAEQRGGKLGAASLFFLIVGPVVAFVGIIEAVGYFVLPMVLPSRFFSWLGDNVFLFSSTDSAAITGLWLVLCVTFLGMVIAMYIALAAHYILRWFARI